LVTNIINTNPTSNTISEDPIENVNIFYDIGQYQPEVNNQKIEIISSDSESEHIIHKSTNMTFMDIEYLIKKGDTRWRNKWEIDLCVEKELPNEIMQQQIMVKIGNIDLSLKSLMCFRPEQWLNDEVLDCLLFLIQKQMEIYQGSVVNCHIFPRSVLYQYNTGGHIRCNKYFQNKNLKSVSKLCFILNPGGHWITAIANIKKKEILMYDSMHNVAKKP